jgi:Cys-tRNA(Pro) deacylase
MGKPAYPITAAIRTLREKNIAFEPQLYNYVERGGTRHSSAALNVPEHSVIKTIVMEDERREPLIVLMHGDREVSTKELARVLGVKSVSPCDPKTVEKHTGYLVGGCSPFGTRKPMRIYAEASIFEQPLIHINGGKRGFLVSIDPRYLRNAFDLTEVHVAIEPRS